MEAALGYLWENLGHRIDTNFGIVVHELDNLCTVGRKHATQELVEKVHLSDDVDKVEHFANKEPDGIALVLAFVPEEVPNDGIDLRVFLVILEDGLVQLQQQGSYPSVLPRSPQPARKVEHDRLQKEDEADPLVVGVLDDVVRVSDPHLVHSGSRYLRADGRVQ